MKRLITSVVTIATVVASLAGFASPAGADPGAAPVILSPADGSTLADWDSSFTVDFSNAPAGFYRVRVTWYGGSSTYDRGLGYQDSTSGQQTYSLGEAVDHTDVTITVSEQSDTAATATTTFHVSGFYAPTFKEPQEDAVVHDWDGRATVDFTGSKPGAWTIHLFDIRDQVDAERTLSYDGTAATRTQTVRFGSAPHYGQYSLYATRDHLRYGGDISFTNQVGARLTQVTASPSSFYPVVRDGFKDSTRITWHVNKASTTTYAIRDDAGHAVWRGSKRTDGAEDAGFTWTGKDLDGHVVPGTYSVELSMTADDGTTATGSGTVKIVTDVVTRHKTLRKPGSQTAKRLRHGDCYYTAYSGSLSIDCYNYDGGGYAEARYAFSMPKSASDLSFTMNGDLRCCAQGRFERGLVRTSKTGAYVFVRLTGLRAYDVNGVTLSYAYRQRR